MTKTKSLKRAMLMSLLALVVCLSMFVGSTFAWFTDSVTSTGNIIKSGTLEVTMEWADGKTDPTNTTWEDASEGAIFNSELWEPGYVEVRHIKIANAGTLALKYQLNILANGAVSELADVIDVYYVDPAQAVENRDALANVARIGTLSEVLAQVSTTAAGELKAGENHTITLALKMQETAGNEYQDKSIGSDFSVQLLATQLTSEKDAFDNQYDKNAWHPEMTITNADDLQVALANGVDAQLGADVATSDTVVLTANLDLGGKTLSSASITATENVEIVNGTLVMPESNKVYAQDGVTITLDNVIVDSDKVSAYAYVGGTLILKDVVFENTATSNPIQNYGGTLIMDNVTVAQSGDANTAWYSSAVQIINNIKYNDETGKYEIISQADTTINSGTYIGKKAVMISAPGGNVTINGGTFVGSEYAIQADFAPNNYTYGANYESVITINGGNFTGKIKVSAAAELVIKGGTFSVDPSEYVADGYDVLPNADGTYTVVKGTVVSGQTALNDAIADGASIVILGSGEYVIPDTAKNKTMTIIGNGDTVVAVQDDGGSEGDIDYSFDGSTVTFENVTLNIKGNDHPGYARMSAVYNNCTITGSNYTLYGDSVFNNCTFNLNNGYVWTWGAANVEFNNCTFEDKVGGKAKAILVHNTVETVVTVKDCKFIATSPAQTWDSIPVAAVSIDPENGSPDATVHFEGTNTYSDAFYALYQVKYADEVDDVTITVDGTEVTVTAMK